MKLTLTTDSDERKRLPMLAVLAGYFAAAMAGLTRHAVRSNEKHNPGEPVHWARGKSTDHPECVLRHSWDIAEMTAWCRANRGHPDWEKNVTLLEHEHDARVWRSSADSQQFYEEFRGAPLPFNCRLPAAAPVLDYSHEMDRTTWPPIVDDGITYPSIWQRASGWWVNPNSRNQESNPAWSAVGGNCPHLTAAAARAAYWSYRDTQG